MPSKMSPEIRKALTSLREALAKLLAILVRESWQFTSAWESAIADVDRMLAIDVPPDEIARWAMGVSQNFGVGMGSLSDVYLGDDFDGVRERVQELLWSVGEAARQTPGNPLRMRRHLTHLETALLDAGLATDAAEVRGLLSSDEVDLQSVERTLAKLDPKASAATPAVSVALQALNGEIASARRR